MEQEMPPVYKYPLRCAQQRHLLKTKSLHLYPMFRNLALEKKVVLVISLALLIVSLTQPAFYTANDSADSVNLSSIGIFFLGWMGFLGGALESFFWFANPLYLIALYRFEKDKSNSIVPSSIACIIAAAFPFLDTFVKNEGGARTTITGLGLGYYFWVASISTLTLGILLFKTGRLTFRKARRSMRTTSDF
jgi:hypothetical protein